MDVRFKVPSNFYISGQSQCGKSYLVRQLTQGHDQTLLVLDDLMSECSKDQRVSDLFTRGSHHKGISVLYLTQNLFPPGKLSRTISLNSHYFIIFKNPRIP